MSVVYTRYPWLPTLCMADDFWRHFHCCPKLTSVGNKAVDSKRHWFGQCAFVYILEVGQWMCLQEKIKKCRHWRWHTTVVAAGLLKMTLWILEIEGFGPFCGRQPALKIEEWHFMLVFAILSHFWVRKSVFVAGCWTVLITWSQEILLAGTRKSRFSRHVCKYLSDDQKLWKNELELGYWVVHF